MREGCEVHRGDLRVLDEARKAMRGCTHVIHLAAIVGGIANFHKLPHTLTEVNNALYNAVFRAALDEDVERFTYVSARAWSSSAPTQYPTREDYLPDCPVPRSAYGFSKLTGEVYCRAAHDEHGLPYTICRPFNAYGPGEMPDDEPGIAHAVPDLIRKSLPAPAAAADLRHRRAHAHADPRRRHRRRHRHRDGAPGGAERGLQHLRPSDELTVAEIARICWEACGQRPGRARVRAPAELRGRRRAPLAVGREGRAAARLEGADRRRGGHRGRPSPGCASARR